MAISTWGSKTHQNWWNSTKKAYYISAKASERSQGLEPLWIKGITSQNLLDLITRTYRWKFPFQLSFSVSDIQLQHQVMGGKPNRVPGITAIGGELDGERRGNQVRQICLDLWKPCELQIEEYRPGKQWGVYLCAALSTQFRCAPKTLEYIHY